MKQLSTTLLAATLGACCTSEAPQAAAPTTQHAPDHGGASPSASASAQAAQAARGHHDAFADADAWTQVFDDPARDAWQRPDEVLRALELTPALTVADVGAGTGYFAVRLARVVTAGQVMATDIEPDMVRFLSERARREGLTNLRPVLGTHTATGLAAASVDRILIVDVWHHLGDRRAYARDLAAALRPGGRVVVVDYLPTAQRGPPAAIRIAPDEIIAVLERAGLTARLSPIALPDQYIVEAHAKP
jgi:arsenite methyltransferase